MFTTNPISLKNLLDDVDSGKIQLPDFQRGWIWDDERIRALLASISRGFPVGAIMTLDASSDMKFKVRPIEGASFEDVSPDSFLLDGQQRLTSLYQAMLHNGPVSTRRPGDRKKVNLWYYINILEAMNPDTDREDAIFSVPENRKTTKNFGRDIDKNLSTHEGEYENHSIPTEKLLNDREWMIGYKDYWERCGKRHPESNAFDFYQEFYESVIQTFSSYQLPVINLKRDTPKEAICTVFEKVNTGGVSLNVFELLTASFAANNFSLRDDWNARRDRMHASYDQLRSLENVHFLQAVTLLATQERQRRNTDSGPAYRNRSAIGCKKKDVLGLTLQEYKEWADKVENGFERAARFLLEQFIFNEKDIPYPTQLVPLAALYVEIGSEMTANVSDKLEHWYWCGVFGEFYGGATETQFAQDLVQVANYIHTGEIPDLISEANLVPERLISLRTRNSAAYKGLYALQMKNKAADWWTGDELTISTWLARETIDIHHIFPRAWCNSQNPLIPSSLSDSIINKTPIDATTNRKIGGRSPSRYLRTLQRGIDEDVLNRILAAHSINPEHLRRDRFADFFTERGESMLRLIGNAMGKDIPSGREVFRNALSVAGYSDDYDDGEPEYDSIVSLAYERAAD